MQRILQAMFPNVSLEQLQAAQQELQSIMQIDLTAMPTKENRQAARRWEQVWEALFLTYQQNIVENLEETSILPDQLLAQI